MLLDNFSELYNFYQLSDKKTKKKINKRYMEFLTDKPCIVSGSEPIHRHHVRLGSLNCGMGMKPADIFCVPLHFEYHTGDKGIHSIGNKTWQKRFDIDLLGELKILHNEFYKEIIGDNKCQ